MASQGEPAPKFDLPPYHYVEEFGFRSARLNIKDLKKVLAEVGKAPQRWTCFVPTTLGAPDHVRRRSLTRLTRNSLDDLRKVAPGGRIFHFEFEAEVNGNSIRLTLGAPWSKTHRAIVSTSHDADIETSPVYFNITDAVHVSAKRGRLWHYCWSAAFSAAIFIVFLLWSVLYSVFRHASDEPAHSPAANAAAATVMTALAVLSTSPLWVDGFNTLTASSVKLKPSAATYRVGSVLRSFWAWIRSVYSREGNLEYRGYIATHLGWIFGAAGMIVAFVAWLYPRGG